MTTQQKAREFWLIRDVRRNCYEACTIKPSWNEIKLGDERIHVIEHSAYQMAVDARDAYAKCMAIALKEGIFANKESVKKQIEETLKELGEKV